LNLLIEIVETNDKKRFSFNDDYTKIRANQGHSIDIDLNLIEDVPPTILYHGTVIKFIDSINKNGLIKGDRHHVHLSADIDTAISVGSRRGKAIVLEIDSFMMYNDGFKFYLSDNGVWLTDHVPAIYISK
jgi:putative RNA 2'-phosphotransferase